jgi:hypothetical protein
MSEDEARAGHEDEKDDVEGHHKKLHLANEEAKSEEVPAGDDDDDFEAHRRNLHA